MWNDTMRYVLSWEFFRFENKNYGTFLYHFKVGHVLWNVKNELKSNLIVTQDDTFSRDMYCKSCSMDRLLANKIFRSVDSIVFNGCRSILIFGKFNKWKNTKY